MTKDVAAIIVAGGQGKRFGGKIRKQYLTLERYPILWWSLRAFERTSQVHALVVVVPAEDVARVTQRIRRWAIPKILGVVAGGATRADSVRRGLAALTPSFRWVAVHDAVRPLVTPGIIKDTLSAARRHKAAIAAVRSRDTVKLGTHSKTAFIKQTPPREYVWLAQTPQIFWRALLERAHQRGAKVPATDDAFLVERLGARVALVPSSDDNFKVTLPMDLSLARQVLKARRTAA